MRNKSKYIYHGGNIMIMAFLLVMLCITPNSLPETMAFSHGMFLGWLLQYGLYNCIALIDKIKKASV